MVKIDIISGFLGAGKTTLLKKLLGGEMGKEKIVLIENEFGEVGIDGSILKRPGMEMKEINSGCICCTLVGAFEDAVRDAVKAYRPDRIVIEPSGVGKLSDVVKAVDIPALKGIAKVNMKIAVVDALKYQMYINNFGEFYEDQISHAGTIVLSRTQKIDNGKLQAITASIRKLNAAANIITTPWDSLSPEYITAVAEKDAGTSLDQQLVEKSKVVLKHSGHGKGCKCGCNDISHSHDHGHFHDHSHEEAHGHSADEVFEVWGCETPKLFRSRAELEPLLKRLEEKGTFGTVLRGKGIVQTGAENWLQFDYVPGECEIRASGADYTGRLCIIGSNLNRGELEKLFLK